MDSLFHAAQDLLARDGHLWRRAQVLSIRPPWNEQKPEPYINVRIMDVDGLFASGAVTDRWFWESELLAASVPCRRYGLFWNPSYTGDGYWYCQTCRKEFLPLPPEIAHADGCPERGLLKAVFAFGPTLLHAIRNETEPGGPNTYGLTPALIRSCCSHV